MTIEDTDKVDWVAWKGDRLLLVITDHLEWTDFEAHAELLRSKIESYVTYIESGQLWELPRAPKSVDVVIELALKEKPPPAATSLFHSVEHVLQDRGIGFEVWVGLREDTLRMSAPSKRFEAPR